MSNTMEWDTLEWASQYAALGWRTVPIRPGTKVPTLKGWQNAATTDQDTLRKWFAGIYDQAGIGVATGQQSAIWVLDVDADHGGVASLKDLVRANSPLPKGPKVDTPSGGFHLYFANPQGTHVATNKNIGQLNGHKSGIDVRGDGGQVLAPPTIHPNGSPYMWVQRRDPWSVEVPEAPEWLLQLVVPEQVSPPPPAPAPQLEYHGMPNETDSSAAEAITRAHNWHSLLERDGWTRVSYTDRESTWTRPGKNPKLGISAILHEPEGPLVNFSTEATNLCQGWAQGAGDGWSYSIFGYLAATRHNGDRSKLAAEWRADHIEGLVDDWAATATHEAIVASNTPKDEFDTDDALDFAHLIDWPGFWSKDHTHEQWAMWPLVPAGRSIALYAPAKAGKSTIVLAAVIAAACGLPVFNVWDTEATDILYLDYEMTESDIYERLTDLGFGPDADLSHLHYAMLPSMFPLDTEGGSHQIVRLAESVNAKIVVIDTFSRAVKGEENDADTSRNFYRFTGMALKARGIACLRTDHAGKQLDAGQRGSSAKNDDVDVVWSLEKADRGVKLTRTHSRVSWVPEVVQVEQIQRDDGTTTYQIAQRRIWPAGIPELGEIMNALNIPLKATLREAGKTLREADHAARNEKIRLAQEWRETFAMGEWVAPELSDDPSKLI